MPDTRKIQASDGLKSLTNDLINTRSITATSYFDPRRLSISDLRAIWRTGLAAKIVRIKAGYSLDDTLVFESDEDKEIYQAQLERAVKHAARYMIGFGRGLIVLVEPGQNLAEPRRPGAPVQEGTTLQVFSGDMVSVAERGTALGHPRYYRPISYVVRGERFHWTRCVDFSYYRPAEEEASIYQYGGISEFELIYSQLVADGVVQRAGPAVLEKSASIFYGITGFDEALAGGQEGYVRQYIQLTEALRSIYGAAVVDKETSITSVTQALAGMADVDTITLRRLAMVTGIPLALLVGENVRGLNSTGEQERAAFEDMIGTFQFDFLLEPIQDLCALYGVTGVRFLDEQGGSAIQRAQHTEIVLRNAQALAALGEDYRPLLEEHGLVEPAEPVLFEYPELEGETASAMAAAAPSAEPASVAEASLNGAQLTSLLQIIERVAQGQLPRESALAIIRLAFPSVSEAQADAALGEVGRGFVPASLVNPGE